MEDLAVDCASFELLAKPFNSYTRTPGLEANTLAEHNQEKRAEDRNARILVRSKLMVLDFVYYKLHRTEHDLEIGDLNYNIQRMEGMIQQGTSLSEEENRYFLELKRHKQEVEERLLSLGSTHENLLNVEQLEEHEECLKILQKELDVLKESAIKEDPDVVAAKWLNHNYIYQFALSLQPDYEAPGDPYLGEYPYMLSLIELHVEQAIMNICEVPDLPAISSEEVNMNVLAAYGWEYDEEDGTRSGSIHKQITPDGANKELIADEQIGLAKQQFEEKNKIRASVTSQILNKIIRSQIHSVGYGQFDQNDRLLLRSKQFEIDALESIIGHAKDAVLHRSVCSHNPHSECPVMGASSQDTSVPIAEQVQELWACLRILKKELAVYRLAIAESAVFGTGGLLWTYENVAEVLEKLEARFNDAEDACKMAYDHWKRLESKI